MSREFTPTPHKNVASWINDYFAQIGRLFDQRFIPGYGGFTNNAVIALADINTTPQHIPANAGAIPNPQGIIQDIDNNALIVLKAGIWSINYRFSLKFDDENRGREFLIEFFNNTTGNVMRSGTTYVGRNQEGIFPAASILAQVNPVADSVQLTQEVRTGDSLSVRISSAGGNDTFENVSLNFFSATLVFVDQIRHTTP